MPLSEDNEIDYYGNDEILCPKCDAVIEPEPDQQPGINEAGMHEIECPVCNKIIHVRTSIKIHYSTDNKANL